MTARAPLAEIEQVLHALPEHVDAEATDHVVDLALARSHRGELGLEVAPVLLGHAHVGEHHVEQNLVELALLVDLARRNTDALLVHLGELTRQRRRHRATDIGVVDVPDREGDDLVAPEDRLPHVQIGRMRADIARIGIVSDAHIARLVVRDHADRVAVIEADEPGRAEIARAGEGHAVGRGETRCEILGLLDEGRMRGAKQRERHRLGRGLGVIGEDLQGDGIDRHGFSPGA